MRLLLIAYEFPPSPSPQSLRWAYLARELHALGHEVHVLTADLGGHTPGLPALPDGLHVHRSFAGPLRGLLALLRKHRRWVEGASATKPSTGDAAPTLQPIRPMRSWRQRISEAVQAGAAFLTYPDIRGEWRPWGRRALRRLIDSVDPDLVISSHEPATTLELGLLAQRRGLPWVADLGDPVLAGYTPPRFHARAHRIEREVCERADLVTVTNPGAAELLEQRHGRDDRIEVVTQGFDGTHAGTSPDGCGADEAGMFDSRRLELLYTGSFYRFRRVDALLQALQAHPAVRLNIAAVTVPELVLEAASAAPDQVRLLGFLPHTAILGLQRRADVLVNVANDDMTQVPGKFYEYLGSGRPILHLGNGTDPTADMIGRLGRGWVCSNEPDAIGALLGKLADSQARGSLDHGLSLDAGDVEQFSWKQIALRLDPLLRAAGRDRS